MPAPPTAMNIISCNVRGLGNDRAFREAKEILQMHRPQLMCLCETKLMSVQMQQKSRELRFENCFEVSRTGKGGGLAMLSSSELKVDVKSFSKHHIDAVVYAENRSYWRCTGVYGHPKASQKHHTWTLLKRLAGLSSLPWLCFGDFNEILMPFEKIGGNDRDFNMMHDFREAIRECDLVD